MRFERGQRVIYDRNPLVEVICQVRFPRMLQIDDGLPIEFQKSIQDRYPLAELSQQVVNIQAAIGQAHQAPSEVAPVMHQRCFHFTDADKKWKVSLSSGFIALTASACYERWEGFRDRFAQILEVTQRIYEPRLITRIGLRYKDLVVRSELGLGDRSWSELLAAHIVAVMTSPPIEEQAVVGADSVHLIQLGRGRLSLSTSLVKNLQTMERAFLVDSDFFLEENREANAAHTMDVLAEFNGQAGGLFRWCIGERLHDALRPRPAE